MVKRKREELMKNIESNGVCLYDWSDYLLYKSVLGQTSGR